MSLLVFDARAASCRGRGCQQRGTITRKRAAKGLQRASSIPFWPTRAPLHRHSGCRIHRPGRTALHIANQGMRSEQREPRLRLPSIWLKKTSSMRERPSCGGSRADLTTPAPSVGPKCRKTLLASGLNASPGAATGLPVIDPDDAAEQAKDGTNVILVRKETSPEDIQGMHAARGILTATGGMTSPRSSRGARYGATVRCWMSRPGCR